MNEDEKHGKEAVGEIEALRNEKETSAMLDKMINAFVLFDSVFDENGTFVSYRFVYINRAYEEITGVKNDEVKGKTVHEVWPETEPEWIRRYGEVAVTGKSQEFELYHDPTKKLYHCQVYRPFDTSEQFCVIFEDITEQKKAEEAHQQSEERYRTIIEHAYDIFFKTAPDGRILDITSQAQEILGYSSEELIGMNYLEILSDHPVNEQVVERREQVVKTGTIPRYDLAQFIHKDGRKIWLEVDRSPMFDTRGKMIAITGALRDVTERVLAEDALRESEEKTRNILESSPNAITVSDLEGTITECNDETVRVHGYSSKGEIIGMSAFDLIAKHDHERAIINLKKVITEGGIRNIEYQLLRKNGEEFPGELSGSVILDAEGNPEAFVAITRDITVRKRQEQLLAARLRLSDIVETQTIDGLLQAFLDGIEALTESEIGFFHFVDEDQTSLLLQTWSTNTLENMCAAKGKGDHYPISEAGVWANSAREGHPLIHNDYENLPNKKGMPEGHAKVVRELVVPVIRDEKIKAIVGVGNKGSDYLESDVEIVSAMADMAWDTVERKRAEELAKQQEETLRSIVKTSRDWIWAIDIEGKLTYSNPAVEKILGHKPEELVGTSSLDWMHNEDRKLIEKRLSKWIKKKVGWKNQVIRWKHKDETWRYLESNAVPILDPNGDLIGFRGVDRDITERKLAEEELLQKDYIIESASSAIATTDLKGKMTYGNPVFLKMWGFDNSDEFLGKSFSDYWMISNKLDEIMNVLQNEGEWRSEIQARRKDGSLFDVQVSAALVCDREGNPYSLMSSSVDITERKKTEEALKVSEENLRSIYDATGDIIFQLGVEPNDNFRFLSVNKTFLEKQQLTEDQVIGKLTSELVKEPYHTVAVKKYKEAIRKKQIVRWVGSPRYPSGVRTGAVSVVPIFDDEGYCTHLIGSVHDITELMKAEEALKGSEEKYRTLYSKSPVMMHSIDPEGRLLSVSEFWLEKMGYSEDEVIGRKSTEFLTEESRRRAVNQILPEFFNTGFLKDNPYEFVTKDGTIIDVLLSAISERNKSGEIVRSLAVIEDVTERKKAEEQIKNIYELSPDLLTIFDIKNRKFRKINPAFITTFGYDEEEMISSKFTDFIHPRDREKTLHVIREALKNEESGTYQIINRCRCKDGSYKWISWRSITQSEEGISYSVGRDITEQKKAEEELKKRLMQFSLEEGNIYLELESAIERSGAAFRDLLNIGYDGVVLSRTPEREFRKVVPGTYEYSWISSSRKSGGISPGFPGLKKVLSGLPKRSAILIDRLDYLVFSNGFKKTLSFIHELRDISYLNDHVIILSVDPKTLAKNELTLLAKESNELESIHKTTLSDDLLDVLRFVYKKSNMNVHATYVNTVREMNISRPTARKRIGELVYKGYLSEETVGKSKRFNLTAKGKQLFINL